MNIINPRGKTVIVQGGQYGSEGKGQITAAVAQAEGCWGAVRTGSINAGHTVYVGSKKCSMQIIPTPWIHPSITLILGPGCYIEPSILDHEVELIRDATGEDIRNRLFIDHRCVWFGKEEKEKSEAANRHHAMGATGKGCSEAIVTKMRDRGLANPKNRLFSQVAQDRYNFIDTVELLDRQLRSGHNVVLEGTQGALLDFNCGPYPFVTSRMTNAAAWLAESGLPPVNVETVLVLRSHPIRVAGNSGPMPLETSWPELAREVNARLEDLGRPPMIAPEAISAFEMALVHAVHSEFPSVVKWLGEQRACKFHLWTDEERSQHRVCLSEANTIALKSLPETILKELAFFEMTTVTKKLRRIARFSAEEARRACAMNAPKSIAYTFLNYDHPELTGETNPDLAQEAALDAIADVQDAVQVPVRFVTTERLQEHVLEII